MTDPRQANKLAIPHKLNTAISFYIQSHNNNKVTTSKLLSVSFDFISLHPRSNRCVCFISTNWGRYKLAAIYHTTFSNAFSWLKMYKFRLRFHWNLFPRVQLTLFQHWCRLWLGAGQATSHCLNQCWLVYWCIYASLGLNELRCASLYSHSFQNRS